MSLQSSRRLLLALFPEHSYAWANEGGDLRSVSRRRGVSVETGCYSEEAGETLVTAGLAEWQEPGRSGRARLVLSPAGRARAALVQGHDIEPARVFHDGLARATAPDAGAGTGAIIGVMDHNESPLAWLARRRGRTGEALIAPEHFQAGERLRRDLEQARSLPSVTSRWDGVPGQSCGAAPRGLPMSDMALAARQRVEAALQAVGPEFSGLLVDVCGFLKGLETVEGERQWPRRSARIVLDLALARLARHYGLKTDQPRERMPMRHWGAQDYRPAIS